MHETRTKKAGTTFRVAVCLALALALSTPAGATEPSSDRSAGTAASRTLWVSPSGMDIGPGTRTMPLRSIQAAVNRAEAGTTIMVRAGTYEGSVDLSGLHGTPDEPINLVSADGRGAARIVGDTDKAAIQAYKISNVGIHDFEVVSNTTSGDIGGMKIAGPWRAPARNIVISGNIVTGKGTDGIKLFNGARDILVVGNTIEGDWRQEAIDNVSVEDTIFAYNTIKGTARYSGITMKAGSRNIELFGNEIDLTAAVGIYVGGQGTSRLKRSFPDYWKGFEASNIHVHGNVVGENVTGRSLVFVGANNSTVERNCFAGDVGSVDHSVSGHFTYHSFDNTLVDNAVARAGFFKPDSGQSDGYVVAGNVDAASGRVRRQGQECGSPYRDGRRSTMRPHAPAHEPVPGR